MQQNSLFLITSILFLCWVIRNTLFWLWLWQIKEYRLDRMIVHIKETQQGRSLIFGIGNILKSAVFLIYFILVFEDTFLGIFDFLISFVFLISFLKIIDEIINKRFKLPVLTVKSAVIFIITFFIILLFYSLPLLDIFFWIIFLDRLILFIVAAQIGIFSVPSELYKDIIIHRSIEKRNNYKDLLVVGITGSYGKGSTKEYLADMLSYKFNVLKTYGTYNTPIAVARKILKDLNSQKQIFIVEMGAYKLGEIAEICTIVKPTIGILTGVNDQHISLFGSLKNTMIAKYELIDSLPNNGLALFSGNSANTLQLAGKTNKKKIIYFADYENGGKSGFNIVAQNVQFNKFSIMFDVRFDNPSQNLSSVKVNLIGRHHLESLLPAIYLAYYLKMTSQDIKNALKKIVPVRHTMEPSTTVAGTVFIDDTHNTNPDAILAACEYMKIYKGKKILVMTPMIELGKNASELHYSVALKIGEICDYLILTNKNHFSSIQRGIKDSVGTCKVFVYSSRKTVEFIKDSVGKGEVVVFEGREARLSLSHLDYEKLNIQ